MKLDSKSNSGMQALSWCPCQGGCFGCTACLGSCYGYCTGGCSGCTHQTYF